MLQDSARYALYLIRGIGIEPLRDTKCKTNYKTILYTKRETPCKKQDNLRHVLYTRSQILYSIRFS